MSSNVTRRSFMKSSAGILISSAVYLSHSDLPEAMAKADSRQVTAKIRSPQTFITGREYEIIIEVTNGPQSIPVGGALMVTFHHAAGHEIGIQVNSPNHPGYVAVEGQTTDNFTLEYHEWLTLTEKLFENAGPPSRSSNNIFHKGVLATVKKKPVKPGEKIRFILGAKGRKIAMPKCEISDHEFRISVNSDGDRKFQNIAASPVADILPGNAASFAAFVPADIKKGDSFEMLIRAEDENYNADFRFNRTVNVYDEHDQLMQRNVPLKEGLAKVQLLAPKTGPQRFRIRSGQLSGRSNPCMVSDTLPEYRIYWGDIHGHTDVSDGLKKTIADYYRFGRDQAALDVCAVSDHGHFDWPQTKTAAKNFYQPHKFVTILAQEGGTVDHINYYFKSHDEDHIEGWPATLEGVMAQLNRQYDVKKRAVIAGPHHFTYHRGSDDYPFGIWDENICRFAEIYSAHGTSEYLGNPMPCPGADQEFKFMQAGLARGRKFGVIACSDTHSSHPGRNRWGEFQGGLVAFLAKELTLDAVWDSFYNYHVYAAALDRVYIDFKINGRIMGTTIKNSKDNEVAYTVVGKTDKLDVHLIHNNQEVRKDSASNGVVKVKTDFTAKSSKEFIYLRIVQENGERAWTTPIWIENV